jgi:LPS O-antigen subunit length determinant protein (WzzB/FepE family)
MPDLFDLLKSWWKKIVAVMILSLLAVGIITFLKPRQFLSTATAVPGNSFASDKSKIFNENIQTLYSTLGTADDLDMIIGTANLDTAYLAVTDQFNLFDHYKMSEKGNAARYKAAVLLKKNTKVMKSEYGELKVKVWDTDKNLAPQLANAIMDELNLIHQNLQGAGNEAALIGLKSGQQRIKNNIDSINRYLSKVLAEGEMVENFVSRREIMKGQIQQYEKLIGEYQLMVDSKPLPLIIVEKAKSSDWPDKPRRIQIMIATAALSFLFALFAALVLERRKNSTQ